MHAVEKVSSCTLVHGTSSAPDLIDSNNEPVESGSRVAKAASVLAWNTASAALDAAGVFAAAVVVAAFAAMNAATAASAAAAVADAVAAAVVLGGVRLQSQHNRCDRGRRFPSCGFQQA